MNTTTYHPRVGMCSWSLHCDTPKQFVDSLRDLSIQTIQLALIPLTEHPQVWADVKAIFEDADIAIASGMFGTKDENYATLESIRLTGGVVPDSTWENNWAMIQKVAPLAESLGLDKVAGHAGFLPSDPSDPTFPKLLDRLGKIADLFAQHGLSLLFETGQETADTLATFIETLGRPNVAVNFDPANMILYAKGDPIESLKKLLPRVEQVHVKDATRSETPGTWGLEVPAGAGEVDWHTFVTTLETGGFKGCYIIEREVGTQRSEDVTRAAAMVSELLK